MGGGGYSTVVSMVQQTTQVTQHNMQPAMRNTGKKIQKVLFTDDMRETECIYTKRKCFNLKVAPVSFEHVSNAMTRVMPTAQMQWEITVTGLNSAGFSP